MKFIVLFSQNLKLDSMMKYFANNLDDEFVFLSTHYLFENERKSIKDNMKNSVFYTFADYLSDQEMAECDEKAYHNNISHTDYVDQIKKIKNDLIATKIITNIGADEKIAFCDDLGIDVGIWKRHGFKIIRGEYYYENKHSLYERFRDQIAKNKTFVKIYRKIKPVNKYAYKSDEVSVSYFEGKKYIFLGNLNRIGYRLSIEFEKSKEECDRLNNGMYEDYNTCVYMTTWHEQEKCKIPDDPRYCVRWGQDGYLPPNYSHKDYFFKPNNVKYFCWDSLGTRLFENQGLPYELIPFRNRLLLPNPIFPDNICRVLVVASGSGDWTALKNRSDDDLLVAAFAKIAERYPNIEITYRCHPTWIHPNHLGVNSINRVYEFFQSLNLPNLKLSSNIPVANIENGFKLSFSRSSLEEDLKKADFVFGEHSISMIDAAFKKIPFASVNMTKRRDFFVGISDFGFPHCTSIDDIEKVIESISTETFQQGYLKAINNYNEMACE